MKCSGIDLNLVRQAKSGDRHAFDILVLKHQRKLAGVISRYLKLPQQIDDVVQETFINAYIGIMAFREDCQFSTWLHRIGINAAIHYLVVERRRIPLYQPPLNTSIEEPIIQEIIDVESPEQHLIKKQIIETVSNALKRLPEELRTVIILKEIDGLSYKKIAGIMGCPIGTVRSRIFRARENIVTQLNSKLDFPYQDYAVVVPPRK